MTDRLDRLVELASEAIRDPLLQITAVEVGSGDHSVVLRCSFAAAVSVPADMPDGACRLIVRDVYTKLTTRAREHMRLHAGALGQPESELRTCSDHDLYGCPLCDLELETT